MLRNGPASQVRRRQSTERHLAGNAIDFFMRVLGLTFNDAMRQITGS